MILESDGAGGCKWAPDATFLKVPHGVAEMLLHSVESTLDKVRSDGFSKDAVEEKSVYDPEGKMQALVDTASEALAAGKRVYVYTPDFSECEVCEGSGSVETSETCETCGGTGMIRDNVPCLMCDGRGTIYEETTGEEIDCPECGGSGTVPGEEPLPCDSCGGSGEEHIVTDCENCGGKGYIESENASMIFRAVPSSDLLMGMLFVSENAGKFGIFVSDDLPIFVDVSFSYLGQYESEDDFSVRVVVDTAKGNAKGDVYRTSNTIVEREKLDYRFSIQTSYPDFCVKHNSSYIYPVYKLFSDVLDAADFRQLSGYMTGKYKLNGDDLYFIPENTRIETRGYIRLSDGLSYAIGLRSIDDFDPTASVNLPVFYGMRCAFVGVGKMLGLVFSVSETMQTPVEDGPISINSVAGSDLTTGTYIIMIDNLTYDWYYGKNITMSGTLTSARYVMDERFPGDKKPYVFLSYYENAALAKSSFSKPMISSRYMPALLDAIKSRTGRPLDIYFENRYHVMGAKDNPNDDRWADTFADMVDVDVGPELFKAEVELEFYTSDNERIYYILGAVSKVTLGMTAAQVIVPDTDTANAISYAGAQALMSLASGNYPNGTMGVEQSYEVNFGMSDDFLIELTNSFFSGKIPFLQIELNGAVVVVPLKILLQQTNYIMIGFEIEVPSAWGPQGDEVQGIVKASICMDSQSTKCTWSATVLGTDNLQALKNYITAPGA
ncbi:MAG: hypothetical protein ILO42_00250 [Clostridia bacterium]|nr:hypothetical protein [Clostridia bacterium]